MSPPPPQRRSPKLVRWLIMIIFLLVVLSSWSAYVEISWQSTTNYSSSAPEEILSPIEASTESSLTVCKFCQEDEGRVFNPTIRLPEGYGYGYTCAKAKLDAASNTNETEMCNALQQVEHLCCPKGNWSHFWDHENNPNCFHLEQICHGPKGEWFYDHDVSTAHHTKHQPTLKLSSKSRYRFNISSSTIYNGDMSQCPYSQTPYHVVSQAGYSHMMLEFYVRLIMGLNLWMKDFPPESHHDVQFYLHIHGKGIVFDGHRLFMGVLPHNNVENFQSLVEGKRGSCECYKTLSFCGYTVNQNENETTLELAPQITYKEKQTMTNRWCTTGHGQLEMNCTLYNDIRQDMLTQYENPQLQHNIREYRRQILLRIEGLTLDKVERVDEWKIVGLTKRRSRRRWLNIDNVVKACDDFRTQKVVCIAVNVEEAASIEEQLLMHMSLNALVGIHGSQLTNGIFLPKHGYIVELLPWIPDWSWGTWAATTDAPTPLGIIYHNTELNHLGYALDRHSVPLCVREDRNETKETECLKRDYSFRWDSRNFEVSPDVVTRFISSFLLQRSSVCDEMHRLATENDFVLYNAYCSHGNNAKNKTEHYYRAQRNDRRMYLPNADEQCAFCKGGISKLDTIVPHTGGETCGSIKLLAAKFYNGTDLCEILRKQENVCCPDRARILSR